MTRKMRLRTLRFIAVAVPITLVATATLGQSRNAGGYRYTSGQDLYTHICQGCHMPDAKGATGAGTYPALAGNPKLEAGLYPVLVVLKGQKSMPSFSVLNDAQVSEVVNYVRSNFGNHFADPVTADQVKELRPQAVSQNAQRPG